MRHQRIPPTQHDSQALFEHMPSLGDEAIWDLLEMLCALTDAYEEHYAAELKRLRLQRYRELHEEGSHNNQLCLPLNDWEDDPF